MEGVNETSFTALVIAGMLLMALLAIGITFFVLIYQRRLMQQKARLQSLRFNHQQELLFNSLRTQEAERAQFAANLHDEIGARLSLAKMTLSSLQKYQEVPSNGNEVVAKTIAVMDSIARSIRDISHNLYPPSLKRLGLTKALKEFANSIPTDAMGVSFEGQLKEGDLNEEVKLHTYRIVQEAVNNAMKHAKAKRVNIRVAPFSRLFKLIIEDDGQGFDLNAALGKGVGLLSMMSRAKMIGFHLHFSDDFSGTRIEMTPRDKREEG